MTELSAKLAVLAAKDASEKLLDVLLSAASDTGWGDVPVMLQHKPAQTQRHKKL